MSKTGVLLINIGSPESYETKSVEKYLKTFLMDKSIISLPFPLRWLLVNKLIVPKRATTSAANYKKIWHHQNGSPLTHHSQQLKLGLDKELGDKFIIKLGMRYSEPSIKCALEELVQLKVDSLLIAPLYPQYAEATTGSSLTAVKKHMGELKMQMPTQVLSPFFAEQAFVEPMTEIIKESIQSKTIDHFVFSFHGLPLSQVRKLNDCRGQVSCCEHQSSPLKNCYPAQCYATANALAKSLKLARAQWSLSFQSRLGRGEWLKPATKETLIELAKSGKKRIALICPSFVADCIETLEEIGMGAQSIFLDHGGEEFTLVPCLNDNPTWLSAFAQHLKVLVHPAFKGS